MQKSYEIIEYEIMENNFEIIINESKEEIVGFICKFYNKDDQPIEFNKYTSYLSISRIFIGNIMNYIMPETIDFDFTYYTEHTQSKNNIENDPNLLVYFLNTPSKHKLKLEFVLETNNKFDVCYMYIIVMNKLDGIKTEDYIYKNAIDDYSKNLTSEDKPYINWLCKK